MLRSISSLSCSQSCVRVRPAVYVFLRDLCSMRRGSTIKWRPCVPQDILSDGSAQQNRGRLWNNFIFAFSHFLSDRRKGGRLENFRNRSFVLRAHDTCSKKSLENGVKKPPSRPSPGMLMGKEGKKPYSAPGTSFEWIPSIWEGGGHGVL